MLQPVRFLWWQQQDLRIVLCKQTLFEAKVPALPVQLRHQQAHQLEYGSVFMSQVELADECLHHLQLHV